MRKTLKTRLATSHTGPIEFSLYVRARARYNASSLKASIGASTISTSERELIERTYMVTPTTTARPETKLLEKHFRCRDA